MLEPQTKRAALRRPLVVISLDYRSRAPGRAATRIALEARAVAHQREVQALRAHLALIALDLGGGATFGGERLGVGLLLRLGPGQRLELLGGREFSLGLRLEHGGAEDFGART